MLRGDNNNENSTAKRERQNEQRVGKEKTTNVQGSNGQNNTEQRTKTRRQETDTIPETNRL